MDFVLSRYNKTCEIVVAIIGGNCSVSTALSRKVKCPLIGCPNHRIILAIKKKIYGKKELFQKVQVLMMRIKYGLLAARSRRLKPYAADVVHDTCWSTTYFIIKRYVHIGRKLSKFDSVKGDLVLPNAEENHKIDELFSVMERLKEIQIDFQAGDAILCRVRGYFAEAM